MMYVLNVKKSIGTSTIPKTILWLNITLNNKHLFNANCIVFDYIVIVEVDMTALSTERMSTSAVLHESPLMTAENTTKKPTVTSFAPAISGLTTMSANATTLETMTSLSTATGAASTVSTTVKTNLTLPTETTDTVVTTTEEMVANATSEATTSPATSVTPVTILQMNVTGNCH